jgi:hypothetical protein
MVYRIVRRMLKPHIFISYSGKDAFEASLLQYAIEKILEDQEATAWTFQRDQRGSENNVAGAIKSRIEKSDAVIFLVSPDTLLTGATQWMELAYADAFDVPTFVLLLRLTFDDLRQHQCGVPPLLLSSQCNSATDWRSVFENIREVLSGRSAR